MAAPNVLVIMTDEERYPPPYETTEVAEFRRTQMPVQQRLRDGGLELHRHYVGSTACVPSRATLFTGQYPSLHGVSQTDGVAKDSNDPGMSWLDPDAYPPSATGSGPAATRPTTAASGTSATPT
jgi:arylsulfatase A-like enzyme